MKKWVLKAIVQKIISWLPYRNRINFLFQTYVTKGVYLTPEYFEDRLGHASNHIAWFEKNIGPIEGIHSFELGCGWYPVVPISLFLKGADKIHSIDISRLMNKQTLMTTLEMFSDYHQQGKLQNYYAFLPERISELSDLKVQAEHLSYEEMMKRLKLTYFVEDLTALDAIPEHSIDLTHSNNTFEHVYPEALKGILRKFDSLVKKEKGCHSHFIDMSDHFAHFDRSITIYNFLRFSEKMWDFIDNRIQPQNRFRLSDYQKLYRTLDIPMTEITKREGHPEQLKSIKVSPEFEQYDTSDLAVSHCHIYSRIG